MIIDDINTLYRIYSKMCKRKRLFCSIRNRYYGNKADRFIRSVVENTPSIIDLSGMVFSTINSQGIFLKNVVYNDSYMRISCGGFDIEYAPKFKSLNISNNSISFTVDSNTVALSDNCIKEWNIVVPKLRECYIIIFKIAALELLKGEFINKDNEAYEKVKRLIHDED